jgi:hypothetical protein
MFECKWSFENLFVLDQTEGNKIEKCKAILYGKYWLVFEYMNNKPALKFVNMTHEIFIENTVVTSTYSQLVCTFFKCIKYT